MSSIMRRRNGLMGASVMGMLSEVRLNCLILGQHALSRYCLAGCCRYSSARSALPRERFSRVPGMLNSSEVKSSTQPDGGEGLVKRKGCRREAGSEGSVE